jgi:hypothetical protein
LVIVHIGRFSPLNVLVGVADNDSPLVVVRSGGEGRTGEFVMTSGAIRSNAGGGVRVESGGTFTMSGGTITGNTGEAVQVESGGTYTKTGGVVN